MRPYYDADGVTIYHGDCREILQTLATGSIDCVVTSPPYNLIRSWIHANGPNSVHKIWSKKLLSEWYEDSLPEPEYQAQQRQVVTELIRVCGGAVFYNHKVRHAMKRLGRVIHPMEWLHGFPLWEEIIWQRPGGPAINSGRCVQADERIFWFKKPRIFHNLGLTSVWTMNAATHVSGHPCPFPLDLPRRCVTMVTDPGHVVLDPYCGAGTTLVVAKQLGRKAIGIDSEERFCELAAKQLAQGALSEMFA